MTDKYIMLSSGAPYTVESLDNIFTTTRLGMIYKTWERLEAFDEHGHYKIIISNQPIFSPLQKFLASTCYNPMEKTKVKWERIGDYNRKYLIDTVRRELETDDDIIQQWFEGPDVMKLMESSKTFEEMMLAVGGICGKHESDKQVLEYVELILGKQEEEA